MLTGRWPHCNGMLGLAHRGFGLADPSQHILHTLRDAGYWTAMVGEQHVSADPEELGYDLVGHADTTPGPRRRARRRRAAARPPARAVLPLCRLLRDPPRLLRADLGPRRALLAPARQPARHAGHAARHGRVQAVRALARPRRRRGARARSTSRGSPTRPIVILTTDHGIPFPGAKATLSDRGLGRDADRPRPGRLPRRPRQRRAGLGDRPVPDALRPDRDRVPDHRPGPLARPRSCAATRARSTTRSSRS